MLVYRSDKEVNYIDKRMAFLTQMVFYHELESKIQEIKDRQGYLTVTWKEFPHKSEIETIVLAWNFLCDYHTEHYFEDKLIYETN